MMHNTRPEDVGRLIGDYGINGVLNELHDYCEHRAGTLADSEDRSSWDGLRAIFEAAAMYADDHFESGPAETEVKP